MNNSYYILLPDQPAFLLNDDGLPREFTTYNEAWEYAHYNVSGRWSIWTK
jgi:hypothetical protein